MANTGSQISRSATHKPPVGAVSRPGTRPISVPRELTLTSGHAPGSRVELHLAYRPDALALEICNDAALRAVPVLVACGDRAAAGGGGHGLVGMRERATMLGGSLEAGPTADGGFRVTAVLPVSPPEEAP